MPRNNPKVTRVFHLEAALFSCAVKIGEINPRGEIDYPGYKRVKFPLIADYPECNDIRYPITNGKSQREIVFPKTTVPITVVSVAAMDNLNRVVGVADPADLKFAR